MTLFFFFGGLPPPAPAHRALPIAVDPRALDVPAEPRLLAPVVPERSAKIEK